MRRRRYEKAQEAAEVLLGHDVRLPWLVSVCGHVVDGGVAEVVGEVVVAGGALLVELLPEQLVGYLHGGNPNTAHTIP